MKRNRFLSLVLGGVALLFLTVGVAGAQEFKEFSTSKFGYKLKIPAEFKMDSADPTETTTWTYQPGAAPAGESGEKTKTKKKGISLGGALSVGGVSVGASKETTTTETSAGSSGGLEPALTIYVNWVWMPDVSEKTSYDVNKKSVQQEIDSPSPKSKELKGFSKKEGYAWEGLAFWYKETDKQKTDEIHRWYIKAFGNKSQYTIGLCGTYEQFKKWGPIYEKVIKSFELIPLEKK